MSWFKCKSEPEQVEPTPEPDYSNNYKGGRGSTESTTVDLPKGEPVYDFAVSEELDFRPSRTVSGGLPGLGKRR